LRLEEVISEKARKNQGTRTDLTSSRNLPKVKQNNDTYLSSPDHDQFCVKNDHNLKAKANLGGDRKSENFKKSIQQKSANLISTNNNHDNYLSPPDHDKFCIKNDHNLTEKLNEIKNDNITTKYYHILISIDKLFYLFYGKILTFPLKRV